PTGWISSRPSSRRPSGTSAARLTAVTPTNSAHWMTGPPPAKAATAAAAAPIANDPMKKRTGVKTSARAKPTTATNQIQRQVSGELTSMAAAPAVLPRRYRGDRVSAVRGRAEPVSVGDYDRWGRRSSWTARSAGAGAPERALEEGRAGAEQVGDVGIVLCRLPVVEEPPAARGAEGVGVDPAEPAGRLGLVERMQPHRLTRPVEADRRCRRCVAAGTPTSTHVVNV